jgi:hypothetical protein
MTNASLAAFKRTVTVSWPAHQQAQAKALLIKTAKDGHQKLMTEQKARSGIAPEFDAYANQPGKPIESVVLPGPIVYRYRYFREVVLVALKELEQASPFESGTYQRSHTLFVNGTPIADPFEHLFKATDKIMIVNTVPYARRIEVGKTKSGRAFVLDVPPRVYDRVRTILHARFRAIASIKVEFVNLSDAYKLKNDQVARRMVRGRWQHERKIRKDRVRGSAITYPALIIEAAR